MLEPMKPLDMYALLPQLDSRGGVRQHHLQVVILNDEARLAYDFSGLSTAEADKSLKHLNRSLTNNKLAGTDRHKPITPIRFASDMRVFTPSEAELRDLAAQAQAKLAKDKPAAVPASRATPAIAQPCGVQSAEELARLKTIRVAVAEEAKLPLELVRIGLGGKCEALIAVGGKTDQIIAQNLQAVEQALPRVAEKLRSPVLPVIASREVHSQLSI